MNRRQFLWMTATSGAAAATEGFWSIPSGAAAAGERRPNVVFVLADQWRAQATGYAGDTNARTRALDRLAAESVNLDHAVSGLPVCCPYRGSLLTGQYPLTNGVFINDVPLAPKGPTLGDVFTRAGYRTGYIGKWHLYGSPGGKNERRAFSIPHDQRFGFDYWKAAECTHDYNHSIYYQDDDPTPHYWEGYDAIAQTEDACGFIARQAKSEDPFCLILSLGPPHSPYDTAPERYQALYGDRDLQFRANVPEDTRKATEASLRGCYSHIAALDDCVGRVLARIEESRIAEDTILVFASDHGDMLGSQGLRAKHHPWDESIRVPFLLRYPRKLGKTGRRLGHPIDAPDIMPTLLGLAGLACPDTVQGTDLSLLLLGKRPVDPDAAALLTMPYSFFLARSCGWADYRGLRTQRYTYVRSIHGPWLLYDNEKDAYQMHNLCGQAAHKALQSKLDKALDARLRRVNDDFLPGRVYLERAGLTHYEEANVPIRGCVSPWGDWGPTMR
ncbi:MAG: sulfatase [Acidobacteria bacterium]|nr:sulfatase [Acidobacteriota bacterium]